MVAPEVQGIDLFKIAGHSISGWVPSYKTGTVIRQPFCSQLEERLMLWLEYHPLVASYARGDIGPEFATKYRLPIPQHAPFAIGYTFENNPHHYLPDVVGTLADGTPFLAEAGMEDDKRGDRNLAKAEWQMRLTFVLALCTAVCSHTKSEQHLCRKSFPKGETKTCFLPQR